MLIPGSKSCWKRDSLVEGYVIFVVVLSCSQQNQVSSFIRLQPLGQFECLNCDCDKIIHSCNTYVYAGVLLSYFRQNKLRITCHLLTINAGSILTFTNGSLQAFFIQFHFQMLSSAVIK